MDDPNDSSGTGGMWDTLETMYCALFVLRGSDGDSHYSMIIFPLSIYLDKMLNWYIWEATEHIRDYWLA